MSAIIRDSFKVNTLNAFIDSLATESLYAGIGRPQYWDTTSNSDTVIPAPENTLTHLNDDWEDMLSLKRVTISDVSNGIFRENWQPNVKYDAYRHDWNGSRIAEYDGPNNLTTTPKSLSDVKCVVITSNDNVYLCLKPAVIAGEVQPSLYSPDTGVAVGVNTGIVKCSDGYYWKFMATTSTSDYVKFASKYYYPIKTLTSAPADADPYYSQWVNQENSKNFKGGIYVINVLTSGSGYNGGVAGTRVVTDAETDSQFRVIGDGTGLQFTVTYGSGGSITDVEVTNPGTGYTHATITAVGGTLATFDIVFTPMTGLGVDPVTDLVARYLIINSTLTGAEGGGDFTVLNDYRKIVLVLNPTNFGSTTVATASTLDATWKLNVGPGNSNAFPADSIVTGVNSGAKGRVVDFDAVTGNLRLIRTSSENSNQPGANNDFVVAETISSDLGTAPGGGWPAIVSITPPEVKKFSGTMLYSEYRSPIMRNELQTEDLRIIVKF